MNDCACIYSSADDCGADFANIDTVKARKSHKCGECRDVIPIGASYERVKGKWEGEMCTFRTCQTCVEIRGLLFCKGWIYGEVWTEVRDYWNQGGNPQGCINKLESFAAKEKLAAEWRDYKGLRETPAPPEPKETP